MSEQTEPSGSTADGVDTSVLRLSPAEREEREVTPADVSAALVAVAREGSGEAKDLQGVTLPAVSLDRVTVEPVDRHPLDLRGADIEALSAEEAVLDLPIRLDDADVGRLTLDEARIGGDLDGHDATVGELSAVDAAIDGQVEFERATFEGAVDVDGAEFGHDVSFDESRFEGSVSGRGTTFRGNSNLLDDNTSFTDAAFAGPVTFRQARFGAVHFEHATFEADAQFQSATFDGDAAFDDARFADRADFDEIRVHEDAGFERVTFDGEAHFRGAVVSGGQRTLEDDLSFADAQFDALADFEAVAFRFARFERVRFGDRARFTEAEFDGDARFCEARFEGEAVFKETRFREDGNFTDAVFAATCDFLGAAFEGGSNQTEEDARFHGVRFETDANFRGIRARSGNFRETAFGGVVDFSEASFTDHVEFSPRGIDTDVYVDFTRATIVSGHVEQPSGEWVRYDLTLASLGDVALVADEADRRELLDYFRFCRTEFNEFDGHEFDFGEHRAYLDRNDWVIHTFDEPPDLSPEYAVEMTPDAASTTYLKAKQAASNDGDMEAAGSFRVKRQQFIRQQNAEVARDGDASLWARLTNVGRVTENRLLELTCGYGVRPFRIGIAFLGAPLLFVPLYAFGGQPFLTGAGQLSSLAELSTAAGRATFFEVVHFSYVSYTTIGYGNIGPQGALARLLAAGEAYLSVVLSALFVYALVKRSEL